MATTFKVFVNGVYRTFTAAEYETEFGYKPTSPRTGERLFGGRYENKAFAVESVTNAATSGSAGEVGVMYNSGVSPTSSIAD